MADKKVELVMVNWLNRSISISTAKNIREGWIEAFQTCQEIADGKALNLWEAPCKITQRTFDNPPQIEYSVRDTVDSMSVDLSVFVCE